MRFLGDGRALRDPLGWSSADGLRRVRPGRSGGLCFEQLGPGGAVRRAYRLAGPAPAPLGPTGEVLGVVTLHGRALAPCCFTGAPPELGGEPRHEPASRARLARGPGGRVSVERFDEDGRLVGETLHHDLAAARHQLEREYGPHLGPLRPALEEARPPDRGPSWEADPRERAAL